MIGSDLTPEQEDVEILMSATRKIANVNPGQFYGGPGTTPKVVLMNQKIVEIAANVNRAIEMRRLQREVIALAEAEETD